MAQRVCVVNEAVKNDAVNEGLNNAVNRVVNYLARLAQAGSGV